jgi:hypothetical protein
VSEPAPLHVTWPQTWRIVPARIPPIDLFERIADAADWEALMSLETLTNPRLRQERGEITLVPAARCVTGPGAAWVMAPFMHPNPRGSYFSAGSYGIYYAAADRTTAIAESARHMARFYVETADPPHREDMRALLGKLDAELHDVRCEPPADDVAAQALGARLRLGGSNGIVYESLQHKGGACIAAFWPDVVGAPAPGPHLQYEWDGSRIRRVYDYAAEAWSEIDSIASLS